ncbi:hypothetical protein BOTBODRAFT_29737 [Botryobasidium botryosum FD-172 SS1]|uniref:Glycosyl transferase family 25 domain-containing protein n=1 Tax=Botryobasidium botryosum (strain FD-172 SS1) TaxID=930990 RepID=A0A067N071_BOTB1|nr:hypothetical protein BOTBODRAFT_29737 [Botryobasidium botryosum FD-172 SS1]
MDTFRPRHKISALGLTLVFAAFLSSISFLFLFRVSLLPSSWALTRSSSSPFHRQPDKLPSNVSTTTSSLGVASRVFVVSLPRRLDRRQRMLRLGNALGFNFTWVDALEAKHGLVGRIMERVRWQRDLESIHAHGGRPYRVQHGAEGVKGTIHGNRSPSQGALHDVFEDAINLPLDSNSPLGLRGADLWALDSANPLSSDITDPLAPVNFPDTRPPILCAQSAGPKGPHNNDSSPTPHVNTNTADQESLPHWRILSRAMIACWHSHLSVLRQVAEGQDHVAIVLEDDVDMEWDLESRLKGMWGALPHDWDLVMLGHCWSKESTFPALTKSPASNLYPSYSPKCTHAYAVSRSGARRLVQYLRTPSFAYSRALDQAIVHLIHTDHIKSFSVYPSVVIQTKDVASDILSGNGSNWRDTLMDSALAHAEEPKEYQ